MPQNTPTHFPGGISSVPEGDPLFGLGISDPTQWIRYFEDFIFHTFPIAASGLAAAGTEANGWVITVTEAGAGNASSARGNANGGQLVLTSDAADNDTIYVQSREEAFLWSSSKRMFFEARFKMNEATECAFVIGLQKTDTSPLDVTDGLFFVKADGSTSVSLRVEKNNTGTTGSAGTLVSDTFTVLSFYFDPEKQLFYVYQDGVLTSTVVTTNAVDDEELTISFGFQNGEAVAKIMTIDYILALLER